MINSTSKGINFILGLNLNNRLKEPWIAFHIFFLEIKPALTPVHTPIHKINIQIIMSITMRKNTYMNNNNVCVKKKGVLLFASYIQHDIFSLKHVHNVFK
jgi:hypothetical protein